jgi:tRNA U34 2-thiouridine synthase MnmA/TrmU
MPDAMCTLIGTNEGYRAIFEAPQWAPTPGQYLVLYDGEVCLGGGVIDSTGHVSANGAHANSPVRDTMQT